MLKLHDFACTECQSVFEALHDPDETVHCECGEVAERLMSAPTIHTLETHFRGMKADHPDEQFSPGHGEFLDRNLTDKAGRPQKYSSLSEKKRLLEKHGLFEKGPLPPSKQRRSRRPMHFTAGGSKRSQLGIN